MMLINTNGLMPRRARLEPLNRRSRTTLSTRAEGTIQPRIQSSAVVQPPSTTPTTTHPHPAGPPPRSLLESFKTGFRSQLAEMNYWVEPSQVLGTIPADFPNGTLYRNGPGLLEYGSKSLNQPFDGDGMISAFSFRDGRVHFKNRYVRTEGFLEEQRQGRFVFKNVFSTSNPTGDWLNNPFDLEFKNVANTGIVEWGGKLLALHESGWPHELSPSTLDTRGMVDFFGALRPKTPLAAHYRIVRDPVSGNRTLIDFAPKVDGMNCRVTFVEVAESGQVTSRHEHLLPNAAFGFFHDFVVTDHYYILFENPMRMDFKKLFFEYMTGKCAFAEVLLYDDKVPVRVHVLPRSSKVVPGQAAKSVAERSASMTPRVFVLPPSFTFHFANAFEESGEHNKIVVDAVSWATLNFEMSMDSITPDYYIGGSRTELTRFTMDLDSGAVTKHKLSTRVCEFPAIHSDLVGRPHQHLYVPASPIDHPLYWSPNQTIVKLSLQPPTNSSPPAVSSASSSHSAASEPWQFGLGTSHPTPVVTQDVWYAGEYRFTQEPIFVKRLGAKNEEDGYLLALVYDGRRMTTDVVLLDTRSLSAGPVATIQLDHHLPYGLHGSWSDKCHVGAPPAPVTSGVPPSKSPQLRTVNTIRN